MVTCFSLLLFKNLLVTIALYKKKIKNRKQLRHLALEYFNKVRVGKEQELVESDLVGKLKKRNLTQD